MAEGDEGGAGPPLEVELKLAASPEVMETLLASPLLQEHAQSTVRSRAQRGVYYDTADHRLRARSAALRVREVEGRFIQTLKSASSGVGAHAQRGEWEVELADATPRPQAFADVVDGTALDLIGLLHEEELTPVFETRVQRRILTVGWADDEGKPAQIEIAFDLGAVAAESEERPIAEIELELRQGEPAALYSLAEALRGLVPLRLEPLDKAARGWLLATRSAPAAAKAAELGLERGQRVEDALALVFGSSLRHWLDNSAAAMDGRDHEGVHQLRVALRRLRSALVMFEDVLDPGARDHWAEELRWLLGELGPTRDLDVLVDELLPPLLAARGETPGLCALRDVAQGQREVAHEALAETLASQRYADLAFRFAAWVGRRGWQAGADVDVRLRQRQKLGGFAAHILHRRHRHLLKRGRHFKRLTAPERHRVRIALKKLRYGIDFMGELFPKKHRGRFRKATAEMQERLGHLNDVAVASRLVHALLDPIEESTGLRPAAFGGGQLIGWYAHQIHSLEEETVAAWKAFVKLDPFWDGGG